MNWEPWATFAVVLLMVVVLVRNWVGTDSVLLGGLTLLMTFRLFSDRFPTPKEAVAGFGSTTVITIAVLFVVVEGLRQTGAMHLVTDLILGRPRNIRRAQIRLMTPVALMSAFLNNTPVVAMFIPVVMDWCKKMSMPSSKLLIPLSYAAILGGACTLIGTSTNIYVADQLVETRAIQTRALEHPRETMDFERQKESMNQLASLGDSQIHMFTIAWVGVPATLLGIAYVLIWGTRLLPDRRPSRDILDDTRRYTIEMLVESDSPIHGKTIEAAGLRHLPGVYLMEIERFDDRIVAVGSEQVIRSGDRLIFVGVVESVRDLQKIRGLVPATTQVFKLTDPRPNRLLVEAVISHSFPLLGRSIREARFRSTYNAAVIAVHRGGQHLANQKIGDIVLRPGDTLLMETNPRFVGQYRNSQDFFLVSAVPDSKPMGYEKAWVALAILAAMVTAVTFKLALVNACLWAAGLMVVTRCCTAQEARGSINWRVLLTLGAAIGVGRSLSMTGAAQMVADQLVQAFQWAGPWGVLASVYLLGMLFNSLIGPIGSASLAFPVALAAAAHAGPDGTAVNFMPFAVTVMMAASTSFATPLGYQTNLMVYGPGGYRFSDYIRIGLPLNFLTMFVTVFLAPFIWPFLPK